MVEEALKLVRGKTGKRIKNLNDLYTWTHEEQFKKFSSPQNIQELRAKIDNSDVPITWPGPPTPSEFPNLEINLLPILRSHPEIEFSLYFPPVSYYRLYTNGNKVLWENLAMRRALLDGIKGLDNVHAYGFDLIEGLSDNMQNYQDPDHYTPQISRYIAQSIEDKKILLVSKVGQNTKEN